MRYLIHLCILTTLLSFACTKKTKQQEKVPQPSSVAKPKPQQYARVALTANLAHLSDQQKKMIPILIEAANIMDELFWYEAYGKKDSLLSAIDDEELKQYVKINYGPWDRLDGNKPFVTGVGLKPLTANFYPSDMSKSEFEASDAHEKTSQYTLVRRREDGSLYTIPYHEAFGSEVETAASLLEKAATLALDEGFRKYLNLRAQALRTDQYFESDMAWMDMKTNALDVVIGPIENYEDRLFNYKSAHEAYILVKDMAWSRKLDRYAQYLPWLQERLPVSERYKQEKPGSNADLNAYDVIYYAGDCNAGAKTIAINLPNDERVQMEKGSRRLQLKNAMRAKFDKILLPISEVLIDSAQASHITFDAFFGNTMFHEVAHGLGIKWVNDTLTVRKALKEHHSAIEEGKADILGLYMVRQLIDEGVLEGDVRDYYVTFLAGIFRSVRFGAASAHGQANMVRFNFFKENGAFTHDPQTGKFRVQFKEMHRAVDALTEKLLTIQGDGDYIAAGQLLHEKGVVTEELQRELDKLEAAHIPVDIVFEQGVEVLGL